MLFFVKSADGGERWILFLVQDNHTCKCVGYTIGRTENGGTILETKSNAVDNSEGWPYEAIMDKHSITRTANTAILTAEIEKRGGIIIYSAK